MKQLDRVMMLKYLTDSAGTRLLGSSEIKAATALLSFATPSQGFQCYPAVDVIAKKMGVTVRNAIKGIRKLETRGLVRVRHRKIDRFLNNTSHYDLRILCKFLETEYENRKIEFKQYSSVKTPKFLPMNKPGEKYV